MAAVALTMTACIGNTEDDPTKQEYFISFASLDNFTFNDFGEWNDAYNVNTKTVEFTNLKFSHFAEATEWDGVVYKSFVGFVPAKTMDTADHSNDDWTVYQWNCMAQNPQWGGYDKPYTTMLAHWDVTESLTEIPARPSCSLTLPYAMTVETMFIANSTWGYWAMRNGTAFSQPFTENSYCNVIVHGLYNGVETNKITIALAKGTNILSDWATVDLTQLGQVDNLYFQMESSDTGAWGMNNPAYFCLGGIQVSL